MWLAALAQASAQPCAAAFTEHDLRTLIEASSDAILREDALTHKRLFEEFTSQVSCLTGQLPKDAWAALLVNEAVVQNVLGGDWRTPLDTALNVFPDVEGVPDFLAEQHAPRPPAAPLNVSIPDDAALFVDGVLVPRVPALAGLHVAQVWRDGVWRTTLLVDQSVPLTWLQPKAREVVEVQAEVQGPWMAEGRGVVGIQLGLAVASQLVEEPGTFLSDAQSFGGIAGFAAHGLQPLANNGGVFWDADLPLQLATVRTVAGPAAYRFDVVPVVQPTAYVGAAMVDRWWHVGAGAGVFGGQVVEGEEPRGVWFPQPHVTLGVRSKRTDFEASGGASLTAAHGAMRAGLVLGSAGGVGWRVGLDADLTTAWFDEEPPGDRAASLLRTRVLVRLGFAWGLERDPSAL